jgi:hypothetical protein
VEIYFSPTGNEGLVNELHHAMTRVAALRAELETLCAGLERTVLQWGGIDQGRRGLLDALDAAALACLRHRGFLQGAGEAYLDAETQIAREAERKLGANFVAASPPPQGLGPGLDADLEAFRRLAPEALPPGAYVPGAALRDIKFRERDLRVLPAAPAPWPAKNPAAPLDTKNLEAAPWLKFL